MIRHHQDKQTLRERIAVLKQIRKAISDQGLTYETVSGDIGMTKTVFTKRITGETEFKLLELIALADYLGIEIII